MHYNVGPNLDTLPTKIFDYGASFEMPVKIGHYGLVVSKETHERTLTEVTPSHLHLPGEDEPIFLDLSRDYNKFSHINWCACPNVKLDEMLDWVLKNKEKLQATNDQCKKAIGVDFVTYRGVLTKLLVTPFVRDNWLIGVTKFKGSYYLCPFYDQSESQDYKGTANNMFSFGGYRFEHYITRDRAQTSSPYPQTEPFCEDRLEYSAVIKTSLKSYNPEKQKFSLLYAAEVDCLDVNKSSDELMSSFVEIKTTREMNHVNQQRNFAKFKLIKWWAQSYLVGINHIICGYKNEDHLVTQIERMNVDEIPVKCSQHWNRKQCFNFLSQFLQHVRSTIVDDDPNKVYLFSREPFQPIRCYDLEQSGHFQILPEWYVNSL